MGYLGLENDHAEEIEGGADESVVFGLPGGFRKHLPDAAAETFGIGLEIFVVFLGVKGKAF